MMKSRNAYADSYGPRSLPDITVFALRGLLGLVILCLGGLVLSPAVLWAAEPSYRATVMLHERGYEPRPCGTVAVSGRLARLDADLGKPGVFRALIRSEDKVMYVLSESLQAYVSIPLRGDERDMRALAGRVAESVSLMGTPLLAIREEDRTELPSASLHGKKALRAKSRFSAVLLSMTGGMDLILWENAFFAPFPLRIQEITDPADDNSLRDSVELADFDYSPQDKALFELPAGYTPCSSVLDMILYSLAQ